MTPLRMLFVSAAAAALVSCAKDPGDPNYETSDPYGHGQGQASAPAEPANPTYDTPAAYEETTPGQAPAAAPEHALVDPGMSAPRARDTPVPARTTSPAHAAASGGTHVVVKGDTLGGIARKYGVSMDAIKKANNMTKDTVVLGKTMVIPSR